MENAQIKSWKLNLRQMFQWNDWHVFNSKFQLTGCFPSKRKPSLIFAERSPEAKEGLKAESSHGKSSETLGILYEMSASIFDKSYICVFSIVDSLIPNSSFSQGLHFLQITKNRATNFGKRVQKCASHKGLLSEFNGAFFFEQKKCPKGPRAFLGSDAFSRCSGSCQCSVNDQGNSSSTWTFDRPVWTMAKTYKTKRLGQQKRMDIFYDFVAIDGNN